MKRKRRWWRMRGREKKTRRGKGKSIGEKMNERIMPGKRKKKLMKKLT